jgi:hypothetical protein
METIGVRTRQKAEKLIKKYGREVVFFRHSTALVDPERPDGPTNNIKIEAKQHAVFYDQYEEDSGKEKTRAASKSVITYFDDSNGDLKDFSFIKDDGVTWKIDSINPVRPGNEIIMYEIEVKL